MEFLSKLISESRDLSSGVLVCGESDSREEWYKKIEDSLKSEEIVVNPRIKRVQKACCGIKSDIL